MIQRAPTGLNLPTTRLLRGSSTTWRDLRCPQWILIPKVEGTASRQAHADLPADTYERELGKEGFYGAFHTDVSPPCAHRLVGHQRSTATTCLRYCTARLDATRPLGMPISSSATTPCSSASGEPIPQWTISPATGMATSCSSFTKARETLYCDYGHLPVNAGDYVILPRGTLWRIDRTQPLTVLLLEATGDSYRLPDKGIAGSHAVFDPATLDTPGIDAAFEAQQGESKWKVVVKRRGRLSTITYAYNPLDAVGWHGTLAPVRLNWRDIRPLMSHRYHVPPSVHTTFMAQRFVVCTFTPRPLESDPGALRVPFYHNNDDYDEIIFYHSGEFFSRDNIHPGMFTLHPSGITHGPHPKAFETGKQRTRSETNEVAVMIDVKNAVDVSSAAERIEWRQIRRFLEDRLGSIHPPRRNRRRQ